jgi:hypothetical protein
VGRNENWSDGTNTNMVQNGYIETKTRNPQLFMMVNNYISKYLRHVTKVKLVLSSCSGDVDDYPSAVMMVNN